MKSETKSDIDAKDKQIKMLQQTLKGMQEQLLQSRKQQAQDDQKIKDLTIKLNTIKREEPQESEIITLDKDDDISEEPRTPKQLILASNFVQVTQKDAKLIGEELFSLFIHITRVINIFINVIRVIIVKINKAYFAFAGLIATFLHIHPFGASVDYLWSYLQKLEPGIKPNEVEVLMQRFPQVFKQELFGIGANMERRWQFSGFSVYRSH